MKRGFSGALFLTLGLPSHSALACAACYGQSDSPMAAGMNWGILSLLVVVALVLGGIAACFVSLARRAASVAAAAAGPPTSDSSALALAVEPAHRDGPKRGVARACPSRGAPWPVSNTPAPRRTGNSGRLGRRSSVTRREH